MKDFKLCNGVVIPAIGLGTWLTPNERAAEIVKMAIEIGYRHIDSAQGYRNEVGVGQGIKQSGLKREELFITTKVESHLKTYQEAYDSVLRSLEKLDVDYIDLVLIHCPQPWDVFRSEYNYFKENIEVWRALEDLYLDKKIRSIGVSNFDEADLQNIFDNCRIRPMVNQIEVNIANCPLNLIKFCQKNEVVVEAYCPNGHGNILNKPEIVEMAKKYNVSPAQICIRFCYQLDTLPLPKSLSYDHIKEDLEIDFEIADADMEYLKKLS